MAREAVRLAEALGAKYLMDLAQAVLTWALIEMEPSMELLETIRNQTRKALERKQLPAAALRMRSVANIVAREYPAAVVPLADFYRHRFGHSFNAFNAKPPLHALVDEGGIDLSAVLTREAGLLPNQPSTVETEFAACIEEALEALERVIAKAHKSGGRLPETPEQPCS